MKIFFKFHLTLIVIADLILILGIVFTNRANDMSFIIGLINLFLGPIQFISALSLLFNKKNYCIVLLIYFILSILFLLFYNHAITIEIIHRYFFNGMLLALGIGHYFVFVLYKIYHKKQSNTNELKNK